MKQAADQVMKTSMELGWNAPFFIFDNANLDAAVQGAMISKFRNNGQTCACANRITVGDGFSTGVTAGPLIDRKAVAKVQEHIFKATMLGAKVKPVVSFTSSAVPFFEPSVLTGMTKDMTIASG